MISERDFVSFAMWVPYDRLASDTYGIAYTVYFYKKFMAPFYYNVKFCGVEGVYPCYNTIYDKTYPYTTEVYVVITKDLEVNSSSYKIRDWLLGIDGQEVVRESGYVPII
jgi:ABC-type phosphate transport system substrate-binding protein